jgi:hypothetical protein
MLCEIELPVHGRVKTAIAFFRDCEVRQFFQTSAEMLRYEQAATASFCILGDSSFTNTLPSDAVCISSKLKQLNDTAVTEPVIKIEMQ